jgi:hypothetical protein
MFDQVSGFKYRVFGASQTNPERRELRRLQRKARDTWADTTTPHGRLEFREGHHGAPEGRVIAEATLAAGRRRPQDRVEKSAAQKFSC